MLFLNPSLSCFKQYLIVFVNHFVVMRHIYNFMSYKQGVGIEKSMQFL